MTATHPIRIDPGTLAGPELRDGRYERLLRDRAEDPQAIGRAYAARRRPERLLSERGSLFLVAADHPARGALGTGGNAMAMADRRSLRPETER